MHVPSKFHIRESGSNMDGVTLSNGTITANGTNSLTLTLSSSTVLQWPALRPPSWTSRRAPYQIRPATR